MAMNDWLVAGINNPDMTVSDMADFAGMTVDNTQFLSADEYKQYDFVRNNDYFKNEQGEFDDELFNNYYAMRADEFNTFVSNDFYRGPALDVFDIDRTAETPVVDNGFNISRGFNPNRQQIGIEGVNVWSDPTFSQRELAKQNKVFNTQTGEFEDYSVNDHTLVKNAVEWFKDLWKDPLVLATWDEDGTHIDPTTGLMQQHVKGEAKLNDKGTYYYETLGDRSVLGKDVLSMFDTLTVDGEGLNKYDFFDSNDLKKSVGGTIMKSVMNALPMFIPYVGTVYSAVTMGRELAKTLPMLSGMVTSLTGGDTPEWAEKASAWAQRASFSMSDRAMQNTFNFEHFANLVSDLALLTGQQKLIAQTLGGLRGGAKYIEEAQAKANALFQAELPKYANRLGNVTVEDLQKACLNKFLPQAQKMAQRSGQLGRDAGLAYIALTMQSGTYDEMLQKGATKKEASAVALGATLGMFSVDKWLHLGELFYNDYTGDTTKFIKKLMKDKVSEMSTEFKNAVRLANDERSGLLKAIAKAKDKVSTWMQDYSTDLKYHTTTATGKIIGGGVERVAETAVSDLSKGMYALAGVFGADTSVKPEDVGVFENAGDRYWMTFLGGALGAGIFYGKEIADRGTFKAPKIEQNFETLIRNGYADQMREEVDRLEKQGKTGSKKLMSMPDDVEMKSGKVLFRTTEDQTLSQSRFIADRVRDEINIIDEAINANEHTAMNDDEVFENLIMGEARLRRYQELSNMTGYYKENGNRIHDYVEAYKNYKKAQNSIDGKPDSQAVTEQNQPRSEDFNKNLDEVRKVYEDALNKVVELHNGDYCLDYTRMLSFALDPSVHEAFMKIDRESYCKSLYNERGVDQLTFEEFVEFVPKWEEYKKNQLGTLLPKAYELYKLHGEEANPSITKKVEDADKYIEFDKRLGELLSGKVDSSFVLKNAIGDYDTRFSFDTDSAYENRAKKMVNPLTGVEETDAEFVERVKNRQDMVKKFNLEQEKRFTDAIREELRGVEYKIDNATYRRIKSYLGEYGRPREVIGRALDSQNASMVAREVFKSLKTDLSNSDAVIDKYVEISVKNAEGRVSELKESAHDKMSEELRRFADMEVDEVKTDESGNETRERKLLQDYLIDNGFINSRTTVMDFIKGIDDFTNGVKGSRNPFEYMSDESMTEVQKALGDFITDGPLGSSDYAMGLNFLDLITGGYVPEMLDKNIVEQYVENSSRYVDDPEYGRMESESYVDKIRQGAEQKGMEIMNEIEDDPVMMFMKELRTEFRNPAEDIIDGIAEARGEAVPKKLSDILQKIWSDYDGLEDLNSFFIDDTDVDNINSLIDIMEEAKVYITAASTTPEVEQPFGHNKTINGYAEKNASKLTKPWKKLPELRSDLAMLYIRQINYAEQELKNWIQFSNDIQTDKIRKIRATDTAIALTNCQTLLEAKDRVIKVNDRTYKIFDGIERIDLSDLGGENTLQTLYRVETLLFDNIDRIAADEGMSIVDLVKSSDLLEVLVPDLRDVTRQLTSKINDRLSPENYNAYSRLMYVASLLSERPADYYKRMSESISESSDFIPIGAQDLASRGMQAITTGVFHQIVAHAYETYIPMKDLPLMERFIMMQGSAGVGKTRAGFVAVNKIYNDKVAWLAAPSERALRTMEGTLNRDNKHSFIINDMVKKILGENLFKDIDGALDKKIGLDAEEYEGFGELKDEKTGERVKYFSAKVKDGIMVAKLNEESISFVDIPKEEMPSVIFIDEVTNLNSVYGQILNKFARENGIFVCTAGDFTQYVTEAPCRVSSVEPNMVFMARMPELTLSMRSRNIQKVSNENKAKALVDGMTAAAYDPRIDDEGYLEGEYNRFKEAFSKIGLSAYIGDEINGDYITDELDERALGLLKTLSESKEVAFIGSNDSSVLSSMRGAGVNVTEVLSPNDMKGGEYDYVVVDYDFKPYNEEKRFGILWAQARMFYTMMTRATEGTIFINKGLEDFVGRTKLTNNKSKAPSVREATEELREAKLKALEQFDFSEAGKPLRSAGSKLADEDVEADTEVEKETDAGDDAGTDAGDGGGTEKSKRKVKGSSGDKTDDDTDSKLVFVEKSIGIDPEERDELSPESMKLADALNTLLEIDSNLSDGAAVNRDIGLKEPEQTVNDADGGSDYSDIGVELQAQAGDMLHESYGFSVLSVNDGGRINGQPETVRAWDIRIPDKNAVARNLQALVDKRVRVDKYRDKQVYEKKLARVRSAAKYNTPYSELPTFITDRFSEEAWKNKRIVIEFRPVDEAGSDSQLPLHSPFKFSGIAPFDAKRAFYANYVLVLEARDGQVCEFDLSGLNDPETLLKNRETIKKSLTSAAELMKDSDPGTSAMLSEKARNIDDAASAYRDWFMNQYNKMENDGKPVVYDVTDDMTMSRRVWKKKTNPLRVDGIVDPINPYDPNTADGQKMIARNFNTFRERYGQQFNISDIFIITNEMCRDMHLSPSLKGRTLVFYTDDLSIETGREMAEFYCSERKKFVEAQSKGEQYLPDQRVRIAMLENFGMSWSEMCDNGFFGRIADVYNTKDTGEDAQGADKKALKVPINMNFTGARMYSSLWNARAALDNFNRLFNDWQTRNGFTDSQVDALAQAEYRRYQMLEEKTHSADEILSECRDILEGRVNNEPTVFDLSKTDSSGKPVQTVESLLKTIDDFNNVELKETPMFRLGYYSDVKGRNLGFHIQSYEVSNSELYKGKTYTRNGFDGNWTNLCSITPAAAKRIEKVLDAILEPLSGKKSGNEMPLIWFGKENATPSGEKELVMLAKNEYLDVGDGKGDAKDGAEPTVRSRSGLKALSGVSNAFVGHKLQLDGYEYGGEELWSMIPRYLSKVTLQGYAINKNGLGSYTRRKFYYSTVDSASKERISHNFEIDYTPMSDTHEPGGNIYDVLNLVFHGTTDNIHRVTKSVNTRLQMSDAYFKYGFYINPGATAKSETKVGLAPGLTGYLIETDTPGALMTVNIMPMESSIKMMQSTMLRLGKDVRSTSVEEVLKDATAARNDARNKAGQPRDVADVPEIGGMHVRKSAGTVVSDLAKSSSVIDRKAFEILYDSMSEAERNMSLEEYNLKLRKDCWDEIRKIIDEADPDEIKRRLDSIMKRTYFVSDPRDNIVLYPGQIKSVVMTFDDAIKRALNRRNISYKGKYGIEEIGGKKCLVYKYNDPAQTGVSRERFIALPVDESVDALNTFRSAAGNEQGGYTPVVDGNVYCRMGDGTFVTLNEYKSRMLNERAQDNHEAGNAASGNGAKYGDEEMIGSPGEQISFRKAFEEFRNSDAYKKGIVSKNTPEVVNEFEGIMKKILDAGDAAEVDKYRERLTDLKNARLVKMVGSLKMIDEELYNKIIGVNC